MEIELKTIASTKQAARRLAKELKGDEIILLYGGLASGKTTFVKYLAEALGFDEALVSSPSFTIINHYSIPGKDRSIYHIDLYRLTEDSNLEPLGLDSVLDSESLVIVEWPQLCEHAFNSSPRPKIRIRFELDKGRRVLHVGYGALKDCRI